MIALSLSLLNLCMLLTVRSFIIEKHRHVKNLLNHGFSFRMSDDSDAVVIRKMGSFEKLLARVTPNTNSVSLSHATAFLMTSSLTQRELEDAVTYVLNRHEVLNAFVSNKYQSWYLSDKVLASSIVSTRFIGSSNNCFENEWQKALDQALNGPSFSPRGPLWRLENIVNTADDNTSQRSAWVFTFNHAIDDQQSVNSIVNDIIKFASGDRSRINDKVFKFPSSIEEVIAPAYDITGFTIRTLKWTFYQFLNGLSNAMVVSKHIQQRLHDDPEKWQRYYADPNQRKTFCKIFDLDESTTEKLRLLCKQKKISVVHALSANVLIATSLLLNSQYLSEVKDKYESNTVGTKLRFLLSVSLRPFASTTYIEKHSNFENDWAKDTVASAAGAIDYIINIPKDCSNYSYLENLSKNNDIFWNVAKECEMRTKELILKEQFIPESVRLFDLGMSGVPGLDILKAVENDANNKNTCGRSYSCGVSNVGVVNYESACLPNTAATMTSPTNKNLHATETRMLTVERAYYGTSHSRNGVMSLLSCMTISKRLCGCIQFTSPLTTDEEANLYRDNAVSLLKGIVNVSDL